MMISLDSLSKHTVNVYFLETVVDKIKKEVTFIDISVPVDKRVSEKENEKNFKVQRLKN